MARVPAKRWATRDDVLRRLEDARAALEPGLGGLRLDELAERAAIAPHHFHRLFKATYGLTPAAYARERRLQRAHLMLSLRQASATEACTATGFSSLSSFSRAFKSRFGYPPGQTPAKWSGQSAR
jgi:AraC-like DNA-binding protein